jgi:DNA-binding PadR family transcriptional regulator
MMYSELSSELEFLILGMVAQGINSGYAMRLEMQRMRGGRWSAESGSVYRVLRRLEAGGFLKLVRKVGVPNRERTEYELTTLGQSAIQNWLVMPVPSDELELLFDPLRTRTVYLELLPPEQRLRAVRNWIHQNKRLIADLEAETEGKPPSMKNLASSNVLQLARARQNWLTKMLGNLKASKPLSD